MKLQATATTAFFPAALVAASVSLALVLLPGAAVPAPSSGVAPALKLVAGEVVAAVRAPVHAVTRAPHPAHGAISSAKPDTIPTSSQQHSASERAAPAHHARADHHRVLRQRPVARKPVATNVAPAAPSLPANEHGNGKANARGHSKKLAPNAAPAVTGTTPSTRLDRGHGKARGHSAAAPHGPPAVPPGQAKKASGADEHAAPRGHGGAR